MILTYKFRVNDATVRKHLNRDRVEVGHGLIDALCLALWCVLGGAIGVVFVRALLLTC